MQLKTLSNSKGFSLPEVIVAMGLLGGISIVTMRLVDQQAANESYLRATAEINKTTALIQTAVNDPVNCTQILGSKSIGSFLPNIRLTDPTGVKYTEILKDGSSSGGVAYYPNFYLTPNDIVVNKPTELGTNTIQLSITFRLKKRSLVQRFTNNSDINVQKAQDMAIVKNIPIFATLNTSVSPNIVRTCGPVIADANDAALKAMCTSMGSNFTWNNTSKRCEIGTNMRCGANQVVTKFDSMGKVTCDDINNHLTDFFDSGSVNCVNKTIEIISTGSKLKIICN